MHHSRFLQSSPISRTHSPGLSLRDIRSGAILLSPDDSGGAPVVTPPVETPANPVQPAPAAPNVDQLVRDKISELLGTKKASGDPMEALTISVKAQHALQSEVDRLKGNQAKKSDLDELTGYRTLAQEFGWKNIEEARKAIKEARDGAGEATTLKRESSMRAACLAADLDYDDFSSRKGVDDVTYTLKDEQVDGKPTKVAYVTITDQAGKQADRKLSDWAGEKFPKLAQAGVTQKPAGRAWPQQGVASSTSETAAERIRREESERSKRGGRRVVEEKAEPTGGRRTVFDRRR